MDYYKSNKKLFCIFYTHKFMEVVSVAYKSNRVFKYVFYIFIFTIIGSLLYGSYRPWGLDTSSISFWLGSSITILILLYLFTPIFSEDTVKEIRVSSTKIEADYLKNKSVVFSYSDISKISSIRIRQQGKAGFISDGYLVTTIHLKNGIEINISQAEIENYREIVAAVEYNLRNEDKTNPHS
jgi:hypothetical protein